MAYGMVMLQARTLSLAILECGEIGVGQRGHDQRRSDGDGAYVVSSPFQSQRFGQSNQRGFGGIIGECSRIGTLGMNRSDIHDNAAASRFQRRVSLLTDGPGRVKIDGEAALNVFLRGIQDATEKIRASVIDNTIQATQKSNSLARKLPGLRQITQVK